MLVPPLAFLALAGLFWVGMNRKDPQALPSMLVGRAAPTVALIRLGDGAPFTDASLRDGKVKIVNFWASWCLPCRAEAGNLGKLAAQGVEIFGVNYKDKPGAALGFLAEVGDPYKAMGADPEGQMALNWGVYGVPENFVIDGQGKVILRFPGPITEDVLASTIEPALRKAAEN